MCVNSTPHTSLFSCTEHALIVAHHTAWLKNVLVRVMSSTWSSTLCGCPFFDSLFLTLFLSVCFTYFFFYMNPALKLFHHVVVIGCNILLALRQLRSLAPEPKTPLSQKEHGAGRGGREDLRTERDKRSAEAFVSL